MNKRLIIDGNSMLFRAFYATIYTRPMKTSNNIPTNAIYAFSLMLNKAIEMIKPDSILVAWDSGKPTFRHELAKDYKGTRKQLPDELISQFSIAREMIEAYNIFQYQQDGIEADDIIGSIAKNSQNQEIIILTSDRDMLQLIDDNISIMLMKKGMSDVEIIDEKALLEWMDVTPAQIIELKALMGDTADNIPGVFGIGEKTAVKLIKDFNTIENLYNNLDKLKGKQLEKLVNGKESAFLSKTLATILCDQDIQVVYEKTKYNPDITTLNQFFKKYEMNSLVKEVFEESNKTLKIVEKVPNELLNQDTIILLQYDNEQYLEKKCIGITISNQKEIVFITLENVKKDKDLLKYLKIHSLITYNAKNAYHIFENENIEISNFKDDIMIGAFLVDSNINDYSKMITQFQLEEHIPHEAVFGKKGKKIEVDILKNSSYFIIEMENIIKAYAHIQKQLDEKELRSLYETIELPLVKVLYKMERAGITTDIKVLEEIAEKTLKIIDELSQEIYALANKEFNINSPKQLGEVLFDELGLKAGKKRSTAIDVLEKLQAKHPIIPLIIQQRKYQKLYSTYAQGLMKHISSDGKIHTTMNQVIAATGRLSSIDPNLQNISVKDEEGREIRKAFTASENNILLAFDYSQIELRVIADMANEIQMINDFNHHLDIHSETAKKIFDTDEVTSEQRRAAKAVNFGIIYGMSDFGLSEQLQIPVFEAKTFIRRYFETYPNILKFMEAEIAFCKENGYVKTMFNRRREIKEINDKNKMIQEFAKRAAMNTPIQGTAADIIKLAMVEIDKKLENMQSKMILQVHDELVFDCVEEEKELVYDIVKDTMINVVDLKVKLEVDGKFAKNYYDAK